jgi:small subunit ribosomal protein S7
MEWIIESASNRKNRGSGRDMFAHRIAETIIAVVEGKSDLWLKRDGVHKLGVAARANMNLKMLGKR